MKKLIILSTFIVCILLSCKKDVINDINQIQPGVWYSADPLLQLPIKNVNGEGEYISFLDYTENEVRYLKMNSGIGNYLYLVKSVSNLHMVLVDTKDVTKREINLIRIN